jgi:hypothetical protein
MKINVLLSVALLAGAPLGAATVDVSTAVQSQPDLSAPVIKVLKAGSQQPPAADGAAPVPDGWTAVLAPGPFEGWVKNKDLTKQLDVAPGSTVYLAPKDGAGVLTTAAKGDKSEIIGIKGSWTQVRLDKALVGYIHMNQAAAAPAPAAPSPAAPSAAPDALAKAAPSPAAPATAGADSVALSRLYDGTLATTRSVLAPRRPYDWQLLDGSGHRIAYIDLSKLLLTDQIENYGGHGVVVLGSLQAVAGTNDLVILAEGLRLK